MLSFLFAVLTALPIPSSQPAYAEMAKYAASEKADMIIVFKKTETLWLLKDGQALRHYSVSLGPKKEGHKEYEGDGRTPEGSYAILEKNPHSQFHRSLLISYPNKRDRKNAQAIGRDPGGLIMIHGLKDELEWVGPLQRLWNWTQGCIAVTNDEIEEIWSLVDVGTPVFVFP